MADSVHQCNPASEPVKPGPDPSSSPFPSLHSEATGPATKPGLLKRIGRAIRNRLFGLAYNLDRAAASVVYGDPTEQETISSEVGRRAKKDPVADAVADGLNAIQPGHTAHAIKEAEELDRADIAVTPQDASK